MFEWSPKRRARPHRTHSVAVSCLLPSPTRAAGRLAAPMQSLWEALAPAARRPAKPSPPAIATAPIEAWTGPCDKPFYFAVGVDQQQTMQDVSNEIGECIEYIPALLKERVVLSEMKGVWSEASAFSDYETRIAKLGLSGRSPQDAFTVACSQTHRRFWEMMVARDIPVAVVFEADAIFRGEAETVAAHAAVKEVIRATEEADPDWELINLGRCWDFCEVDVPLCHMPRLQANVVRSVSMGCTQAIAVTLTGAKKLLTLSLPHITSVDYLMALLSRVGLLRQYSVSPPLFGQRREGAKKAHDQTKAQPPSRPSVAPSTYPALARPC